MLFIGMLVGQDNLKNNKLLVDGTFSTLNILCGNEGFWDPTVNYRFFNKNANVNDKKKFKFCAALVVGRRCAGFFAAIVARPMKSADSLLWLDARTA
jgi:hypothetical protein